MPPAPRGGISLSQESRALLPSHLALVALPCLRPQVAFGAEHLQHDCRGNSFSTPQCFCNEHPPPSPIALVLPSGSAASIAAVPSPGRASFSNMLRYIRCHYLFFCADGSAGWPAWVALPGRGHLEHPSTPSRLSSEKFGDLVKVKERGALSYSYFSKHSPFAQRLLP